MQKDIPRRNLEVSMRVVGQIDAIESVTFKHAEGNEGKKNGVKRGNAGFFGGKLLKRQGRISLQVRVVQRMGKRLRSSPTSQGYADSGAQLLFPLQVLTGFQKGIGFRL